MDEPKIPVVNEFLRAWHHWFPDFVQQVLAGTIRRIAVTDKEWPYTLVAGKYNGIVPFGGAEPLSFRYQHLVVGPRSDPRYIGQSWVAPLDACAEIPRCAAGSTAQRRSTLIAADIPCMAAIARVIGFPILVSVRGAGAGCPEAFHGQLYAPGPQFEIATLPLLRLLDRRQRLPFFHQPPGISAFQCAEHPAQPFLFTAHPDNSMLLSQIVATLCNRFQGGAFYNLLVTTEPNGDTLVGFVPRATHPDAEFLVDELRRETGAWKIGAPEMIAGSFHVRAANASLDEVTQRILAKPRLLTESLVAARGSSERVLELLREIDEMGCNQ